MGTHTGLEFYRAGDFALVEIDNEHLAAIDTGLADAARPVDRQVSEAAVGRRGGFVGVHVGDVFGNRGDLFLRGGIDQRDVAVVLVDDDKEWRGARWCGLLRLRLRRRSFRVGVHSGGSE